MDVLIIGFQRLPGPMTRLFHVNPCDRGLEAFSIPFYGFSDGSLGEKLETGMESVA